MALHPCRILSLCAGVGGLDLGIRLAEPAARSVCYVEREAAAASILVARMEDGWLHPTPIWSDLATFDAGAWRGAVDCVVSGDPCQPNSVAGRGLGDADERWLADRVVDTFDRSGARRLFKENVPGNADGQLAYFVPALERLGCRVAVGLFSAKELGFAHGRERLFIMAERAGLGHSLGGSNGGFSPDAWRRAFRRTAVDRAGDAGSVPLGDAAGERSGKGRAQHAGQQGRCASASAGSELADAYGGVGGHRHLQRSGQQRLLSPGDGIGGVPLLTPGPADRRWPDIITRAPHLEPSVRRMAHGMADRVDRLRACGNGVVPLVAGYAWRALTARLAESETGDVAVAA